MVLLIWCIGKNHVQINLQNFKMNAVDNLNLNYSEASYFTKNVKIV